MSEWRCIAAVALSLVSSGCSSCDSKSGPVDRFAVVGADAGVAVRREARPGVASVAPAPRTCPTAMSVACNGGCCASGDTCAGATCETAAASCCPGGSACADGCASATAPTACLGGTFACGAVCCPPGSTCASGTCVVAGSAECATGAVDCGGTCCGPDALAIAVGRGGVRASASRTFGGGGGAGVGSLAHQFNTCAGGSAGGWSAVSRAGVE